MKDEIKGAECPNPKCKKRWVWDWGQDSYRDLETGEFCNSKEIYTERTDIKDGIEVELLQCGCGCVLSVNVTDPTWGMGPYNSPEWSSIDWEDHKYCYDK